MTLTPTDMTKIATAVLAVIVLASLDDPRAWSWVKTQWSKTVGAFFARRRMVASFAKKRQAVIRVGKPDSHSPGIMVARRDVNTGVWS